MEPQQLLEERGKEYGEAHVLTGLVLKVVSRPFTSLIGDYPELAHDWVLMLSKLIRILFNPTKVDSYEDLIGYATLCLDTIRGEGDKHDSISISDTLDK